MSSTPDVIVITGPTATGKTSLGVRVAELLCGEIVSADSMQVYRDMNIGTAKPSAGEMKNIPHHMIDIADPQENYSVARYVREALPCVDDIIRRGRLPVIVGGTGLYIDSLIRGRVFASRSDPGLRRRLEARYDLIGGKTMLDELAEIDSESAERLHENDKKRIVRAFEVYETTRTPLSVHDAAEKKLSARYSCLKIILSFSDREALYDIIRRRVDAMMSAGLRDEVASLLDRGISRAATSMQAIGYRQIASAICGETTLTDAVEKVKMESTRYAKRQMTWLRRDAGAHRIDRDTVPDIEQCAEIIRNLYNETK